MLLPDPIVSIKPRTILRGDCFFKIPLDIVRVNDRLARDIEVAFKLLGNLSFGHILGFFFEPLLISIGVDVPQKGRHIEIVCSVLCFNTVLMEPVADAIGSRECDASTTG